MSKFLILFNAKHEVDSFIFNPPDFFCCQKFDVVIMGEAEIELSKTEKIIKKINRLLSKKIVVKNDIEIVDKSVIYDDELLACKYDFIVNLSCFTLQNKIIKIFNVNINGGGVSEKALLKVIGSDLSYVLSFESEGKIVFEIKESIKKPLIGKLAENVYLTSMFAAHFLSQSGSINFAKDIKISDDRFCLFKYFKFILRYYLLAIFERYFSRDKWLIFYSKCSSDSVRNWCEIPTDNQTFVADPFLFEYEDQNWIIYEECALLNGKGTISIFNIEKKTVYNSVIEESYHLSYPYLIENGNEVLIMPQSNNGKIDLYKLKSFPSDWIKCKTLISSDYYTFSDSSILTIGGVSYLFTNVYSRLEDCNKFCLRFNIVGDIGSSFEIDNSSAVLHCIGNSDSRMAGDFFEHNNVLIRPTQDCSTTYGGAINFKEIHNEEKNEFKESLLTGDIFALKSTSFTSYGYHTYNSNDNYMVIDSKKKKINLYIK